MSDTPDGEIELVKLVTRFFEEGYHSPEFKTVAGLLGSMSVVVDKDRMTAVTHALLGSCLDLIFDQIRHDDEEERMHMLSTAVTELLLLAMGHRLDSVALRQRGSN